MMKFSTSLILLALLAVGPALAQATEDDEDVLTPQERILARHPNLHPHWTWMREGQAIAILQSQGYDKVISLEKFEAFWRGKALKGGASYHVAVNRYGEAYGHMDQKSLIAAIERRERAKPKTMLATLNGPVEAPTTQMAPPGLQFRPVATVMGEVAWTWMREDQAIKMLEGKGYADIKSLRRDEHGIWRGKASKDDMTLRVAVDVYGNVATEPEKSWWSGSSRPLRLGGRGRWRLDSCHALLLAFGHLIAPMPEEERLIRAAAGRALQDGFGTNCLAVGRRGHDGPCRPRRRYC